MPNLITDPQQIRLQEENEVQAILGRHPSWLTRWGITLVLAAVVSLLFICARLRYPDIVEAPATILTDYPPERVEAKVSGAIEQLLVGQGQTVAQGQLLAVIESPTPHTVILAVQQALEGLSQAIEKKDLREAVLPSGLRLGDLQPAYAQVYSLLEIQRYRLQQDHIQQRIASYREQIRQLAALDQINEQVKSTLGQEVAIAESDKEQIRRLIPRGASDERELEQAEIQYLQARRQLEALQHNRIQYRLDEQRLQAQIIELTQLESEEIKNGWIALTEAIRQLQGKIDLWEDAFLIRAPIDGKVVLSEIWSPHQSVDAGQVVLTIDPAPEHRRIIARAEIPPARSGKVEPGDTVLLRLHAFPYKEFGVLKGTVGHLAAVPDFPGPDRPPVYYAQIALSSDSLITTHGRLIPFSQEMAATARIITDDRSFLERVMNEIRSRLENN